jgi:phosphotransferase system enzyme I (PtsP)
MNLPHELSLVIQRSHSLTTILDSAVQIVARHMGTDVCSIYLLDPVRRRLRLMATQGLDKGALGKVSLALGEGLTGLAVAEMRSLAVEDASSHPGFRYFPETHEELYQSFLAVPLAIRNRPVGAIVVQTRERRKYSEEEIQTLTAIAAQLVGMVENARLIEALDRGEEGSAFLAEVRRWQTPSTAIEAAPAVDVEREGIPISPGIAIGEAVFRGSIDFEQELSEVSVRSVEEEKRRLVDALEKTRSDILSIQKAAEKEADEEHALIFSSHLLLLNDPVLHQRVEQAIEGGRSAAAAVHGALTEYENRLLRVADPYIRERVEDIRDLDSRILSYLLSSGPQGTRLADRVVVTRGLPPSLVVELKAEGALGLITEYGGATSHGALLARSMRIPVVTGILGLFEAINSGDRLVVDGTAGRVVVNPSAESLARYREQAALVEHRRTESLRFRHLPAQTADGREVQILANIAVAADLAAALEYGAHGVGLYRTEFPFLIREDFPTREEQVRIYSRAYEYFPQGPINFRILDLGADKFLLNSGVMTERNPFSGYRSIRVLLDHPHVLKDQVQAFALAAAEKPLSILIPLVSSLDELRRVKRLIAEALASLSVDGVQRDPEIGIMVELPATVEIASYLAKEVDYLSIGTNDLIQYALAVDRESSRLSAWSDPYHPAILRMVRRTVLAAHAEGRKVSVCGEMASDGQLALVLLAMGVDSLSVTPSAIAELKQALASRVVAPLASEVDSILGLADARSIRRRVEELVYPL